MDARLSPQDEQFRVEVREFLDANLSESLIKGAAATTTVFAEPDIALEWQAILHRKGWLGYNWPKAVGGTGWNPVQRYLFERECALAGAPELPGMGLKLLGPVLYTYGTLEQQNRYLPRVLSAEDLWCQGFSEPAAGSDLADLKTTAVREGDHFVINGSKLWTTQAQFANRIFCLLRTQKTAVRQQGISFLLVDLRQPGIEIRPIITLAGDHEVNAVFFDNAIAPASDLVGEEGQGWSIAKFLLENERAGSCHAPKLLADIERLKSLVRHAHDGSSLRDFAAKLADVELAALALETTELRILAEISEGRKPGPQTSLVKLVVSNVRQEIDWLVMEFHGLAAYQQAVKPHIFGFNLPNDFVSTSAQVAWAKYLNGRAWTIFGGTSEIQRTIIAKSILRL